MVAQAISIFTAPVLTRIYFPADYGLLGIYMIFCSLVSTLSTMQFHNAIITAENDDVAKDAFRLCLLLNVVVSILLALVVFVFGHSIASIYNNEQILKWLPFAPLSSFLLGANLILSAWAHRKKKFKLISYNRIFSAVLAPVFSIVIGIKILGPSGLFAGLLVSQVIPVIRMGYQLLKADNISLYTNKASLRNIVNKFRNYPIYSLPSEFINNLSNQFPVMMLTQTGGIQVVGWYNLSVRMLGLPATLISASIGEVFRQRASEDYFMKGTCRPVFVKVFKTLSISAILPLLILILFGPYLFAVFFGKRWAEAGVITQVLAILYAFKFVASPLSYVTYIANKQWVGLLVDISLLMIILIIYYAAITYHLHYLASLSIFSLCYSSLYFLTFYLSYKFTINEKFAAEN